MNYVVVRQQTDRLTGKRTCVLAHPDEALAQEVTIWNGGLKFAKWRMATGIERSIAAEIVARPKLPARYNDGLDDKQASHTWPKLGADGRLVYN